MTSLLVNTPAETPIASLLLAHGAGAPMDSEFMTTMAQLLCQVGCEVIRFEFPYMAERRLSGKKRPPEREPKLTDAWREQVLAIRKELPPQRKLIIGGKSLGGRMASLVADELAVTGLVCFGYPFHPVAKPQSLRVAHLEHLQTPTLIVQGTRDPLGSLEDVAGYTLASTIGVHWLPDGDHDFKPRVKSGYCWQQHLQSTAETVRTFIDHL